MEEQIIGQGDLKVISTRILIEAIIEFHTFSSGTMMMPASRALATRDSKRRLGREGWFKIG